MAAAGSWRLLGEREETGMYLTLECSCSRAPIRVPENPPCRSHVGGERGRETPQREYDWYRPSTNTQEVGGWPHVHREDLRRHCPPVYIPGSRGGPVRTGPGFTPWPLIGIMNGRVQILQIYEHLETLLPLFFMTPRLRPWAIAFDHT